MLSAIWLSFLLGLDSFVVSFALGPSVRGRGCYGLAFAFGICDAAAIPLGPVLGSQFLHALAPLQDRALPVLMICYAIYVAVLARSAKTMSLSWPGWLAFPIAASLDNLVAGPFVSGTVTAVVGVSATAIASAAMSLAGLSLSAMFRPRLGVSPAWRSAAPWVLGAALLAAAG